MVHFGSTRGRTTPSLDISLLKIKEVADTMKRIVPLLLLVALALSACAGGSPPAAVADPPGAQPFEQSDSAQVNQIIQGWQAEVPAEMQAHAVKPETIEEKVFQTEATLQQVADHYNQLTAQSWIASPRMPGLQADRGILLLGYEHGTTDLVVGALDASKFGGSGVVVYTARGTR